MLREVLRVFEDDHIAAFNIFKRQNFVQHRPARAEDELVNEQMVSNQEVIFHRGRGDFECLND